MLIQHQINLDSASNQSWFNIMTSNEFWFSIISIDVMILNQHLFDVMILNQHFYFMLLNQHWFDIMMLLGAQWLSGRVLDSRLRVWGFEPHQRHCVVSLSKTHLSLLSTGTTQEDPFQHNWKLLTGTLRINSNKHISWCWIIFYLMSWY